MREEDVLAEALWNGYELTKKLSTELSIYAGMAKASPTTIKHGEDFRELYFDVFKTIKAFIRVFEEKIWFPSLQPYIQQAEYKGHSGETNSTKIMAWACAGRVMITLVDKDNAQIQVTLIAIEDEKSHRMGLQSVYATEKEAIDLIWDAIINWPQNGLKVDKNVGIGV